MERRRLAALLAAATLVASLGAATAAPTLARAPRAETAAERNARLDKVWTAAQMRAAIPRDFVRNANGKLVPRAKPGGSGGAVTGASWTRGGTVLERTGKVFFRMGGSGYVCSGSVAQDASTTNGFSLVLTAGHCAFDETAGAFATDWTFVPNYDASPTFTCSAARYGCWDADALVVHNGYAEAGGFNDQAVRYDFAFAVVRGGDPRNDQLDAVVGSYPVAIGGLALNDRAQAFGYPAAGKYHGNDLTWCAGAVKQDQFLPGATWGIACGMTGGSSGGPWFEGLNETTGAGGSLSSLNSYGYSGIKDMYGPRFNSDTNAVYQAARGGPSNDTRVGVAP